MRKQTPAERDRRARWLRLRLRGMTRAEADKAVYGKMAKRGKAN